tara:strand:+ start:9308 stop:10240 length:933 start_codon:yes stop_codon:yes gene_type:complete
MIGIGNIASFIPLDSLDNLERIGGFGETSDFIINKIGALKLPQKGQLEETSDLAVKAVEELFRRSRGLDKNHIDALVIVTQNGDGEGLPHTAAIVQEKLGLPRSVAAFDVSLGCSGYVYALHILKGFMESAGLKNGILVTADPYSKIVDPSDKNTSLLFGDAATATWLTDSADWEIGPALFGTDGKGEEALKKSGSYLTMNGRQVFDFAAKNVAPSIKALLEKAVIAENEIDAFCIHQGSYAVVDAVSRRFKENRDKFLRDIENTGNTVSSSIPLLLENHVLGSDFKKVIISGFGVGFSWATALLTKNVN